MKYGLPMLGCEFTFLFSFLICTSKDFALERLIVDLLALS